MPQWKFSRWAALSLVVALAVPTLAITGGPRDYVCPLCKTKNTFWAWHSYGSYIYHYPTKFQLVFWPLTSTKQLFHCKKCHFTVFMEDFERPPAEKVDETRALLKDVKLTYDTGDWETIPMFERLEVAEKIYRLWGRDQEWWCRFYRVKGYHLEEENQIEGAQVARQKALELALKLADHPQRTGEKKQFLFLVGSMRYYTGDAKGAAENLRAALALTFRHPEVKEENNKGYDQYLSEIIKQFLAAIEAGYRPDKPPEKPANSSLH